MKTFVGDNPKRAFARNALQFNSLYGCEYCFHKGTSYNSIVCDNEKKTALRLQRQIIVQKMEQNDTDGDAASNPPLLKIISEIDDQIKGLGRKTGQVVWPSSSKNGEIRTKYKVLQICTNIANNVPMTKDDLKGIKGHSPLLDLHYFNFVKHIPAEHLHSMCLGVTKWLVELTFSVGTKRLRITKRKLSNPTTYNNLMSSIKVVFEFPRRIRFLDFAVMKGQEFRNLVLFFFPVVIDCIEKSAKERKLWLLYAYMMRSCTVQEKEFQNIPLDDITFCCHAFYDLYEKLFSVKNCTYNVHVVSSHLLDIRDQGPLTATLAFGFENFYGELRHAFVPGTPSPLKQMMQKILLKRQLIKHQCKPKFFSK